jgi:hypothetical protein
MVGLIPGLFCWLIKVSIYTGLVLIFLSNPETGSMWVAGVILGIFESLDLLFYNNTFSTYSFFLFLYL